MRKGRKQCPYRWDQHLPNQLPRLKLKFAPPLLPWSHYCPQVVVGPHAPCVREVREQELRKRDVDRLEVKTRAHPLLEHVWEVHARCNGNEHCLHVGLMQGVKDVVQKDLTLSHLCKCLGVVEDEHHADAKLAAQAEHLNDETHCLLVAHPMVVPELA